uniref:[histone H4]-lysine(20) N-methyltransferase n=1 Tax=Schizaphis graminum TaxID=13262 RepID=A0A2S2PMK3_SCHGA
MLNTLKMVKKKTNKLASQNSNATNKRAQGSIKKYCTKKKTSSNDNEKVIKDMPLVSDTTFNSKADFNQSPLSSKLNSSHKISLNVKHINDTSNNKQQKVTAFFPIRRSARKTKNIVNEEKQIALEEAIASQNEDGLKITVFPNKGRGIIAGKDFARGEYVVEYSGELICVQEARKREAIYSQDTSTGCYMYYFKYGSTHYCIDATPESSRLGRLVNHSRFGNLVPKVVEVAGLPRIVLIAKSDIKRDEELTYDYGDRSKESLINHPWLAY